MSVTSFSVFGGLGSHGPLYGGLSGVNLILMYYRHQYKQYKQKTFKIWRIELGPMSVSYTDFVLSAHQLWYFWTHPNPPPMIQNKEKCRHI